MYNSIIKFIQELYQTKEFIPLHAPSFQGNEKKYVLETLDSTFVSTVGQYVDQFEKQIEDYTKTSKAIATVNGTAALHTALYMAGVRQNDLVITQALTFVATCNALYHMGAEPVFVDISKVSLGLCPKALNEYLHENAKINESGYCEDRKTGQIVRAVVPMHTFGHPVELDEVIKVCKEWNISLVEDAAESLGSFYKKQHTGTFADFSALSFNGNKIITTGGGGMVLCKNHEQGLKTKHITTTAKKPHAYEFFHDEAGFNYRLPNLNAALGCAQMEILPSYLQNKRKLAKRYQAFFEASDFLFVKEPEYACSNYWLNAIICPDQKTRENFIRKTNELGVMTRPVWQLMHRLPMYQNAKRGQLEHSIWIEKHLVNIPSSPILK